MTPRASGALRIQLSVERFPLRQPFRITGYTMVETAVVTVTLERDGHRGRGEAAGVYYRGDDVAAMVRQIEAVRSALKRGTDRQALQQLLPAGGARNAVDCALWDLEARVAGQPAWQIAGLEPPRPLLTTFTVGADSAQKMADGARAYIQARAIKLKLTGLPEDAERVRAVRAARPDVWLGVDANQGFTRESLRDLMPTLIEQKVSLIEQPFPIGREAWLDGLESPIPIAADESVQELSDLPLVEDRVNVINIKLDKCGGLTHGLELARAARRQGLAVMVGNMMGSSLAMAPSFLLGQLCSVVDLDGPALLAGDRDPAVCYGNGSISCPEALWGYPVTMA